jgi:purine-nucleoside phosphorylase
MLGRAHYYETGDPRAMAAPLETLALLGTHSLLLTAAAGSLKADFFPGTLALVTDHINFSVQNPLIGLASDGGFVSLTETYDQRLMKRLKRATIRGGVTLHEGVYMWFSGPSFETPAEIRMARILGADLVGMSIVPEAILARRLGLRVAAVSVITNFGAGFSGGNPSHTQTKEVAMQGAIALRRLVRAFLKTKEDAWGGTRVTP